MLAAALVPHPPLLVPELAAGSADEVAGLLGRCEAAVAGLLQLRPELLVCLGPGSRTRRHPDGARGSLGGHGVAVTVPPGATGPPVLPLSLTVGCWLLCRAGWTGPTWYQEVDPEAGEAAQAQLGAALASEVGPRAAWLLLADGCAAERSGPLPLEPAALLFEQHSRGRAAWQVLVAAAVEPEPVRPGGVSYAAAPFGVGYLVAAWDRRHP